MKSKQIPQILHIFAFFFAGITAGLLIKFFILDFLHIQGKSMEPTFKEGDVVPVLKAAYGLDVPFGDSTFVQWKYPEVGDVVIYMIDGHMVIKRCAAVGGCILDYSFDSGYTLRAGDLLIPLTVDQYHLMKDSTSVPEGTILALGDNYSDSVDSRKYGFVPVKNILGKVLCRRTAF